MYHLDQIVDDALHGAEMCMEAYKTDFNNEMHGYINKHDRISHEDQECYILSNNVITAIVFPGTKWNEGEDVKLDLTKRYDKEVTEFGIFEGVNKGLNYIWDDIIDALMLDQFKNRPIEIYGHSLGAGYATESARRLNANHRIKHIHTYGAFKIYDARGYKNYPYHGSHYTWINCSDMASRFPLRRFKERHVGNIMYLTRKRKIINNVSGFRFWLDYFISPLLRALEHRILNYIKRLKKVKV